jgi:hypothetical protein
MDAAELHSLFALREDSKTWNTVRTIAGNRGGASTQDEPGNRGLMISIFPHVRGDVSGQFITHRR